MADLHLSGSDAVDKPMEVFGKRWTGHTEKIIKNWRAVVGEEDTVIVPGDISWALETADVLPDLRLIDSLPGKKFLGKGNHDYWWATMAKLTRLCADNELSSISFLYNSGAVIEDFAVAGTRGWWSDVSLPGVPDGVNSEKITLREAGRLRSSLAEAVRLDGEDGRERLVFLHFPPVWSGIVCRPIVDVLHEYGVRRCYFGHIHGQYTVPSVFTFEDISFSLISADYLNFAPRPILPEY